jgi:hypothetical protein
MRFLSILIILLAAAVVSLSGSQAKTVNEIPGSTNKTELGPHKNPTDLFQEIKKTWAKLTAPKYKDPKDICVWKICSRPLKKKTKTGDRHANVNQQNSGDAKWEAIYLMINSRIVNI